MLNKAINLNKKFRGSYIDSAGVLHEDWYSAETLISFFHANWPQIGSGKKVITDLDGLFTFIGYNPASPPERAFDVDTRVGALENWKEALENWKPDSTGAAIDAAVDQAPSVQNAEAAPLVMQKAAVTYDTDKITFTAKATGAAGNGITVEASLRLSATLGSGATEITLIGEDGLYPDSEVPLVSVQIVQAATEAPLLVSNTEGVIIVSLPADESDDPKSITIDDVAKEIADQMLPTKALNGVIAGITTGASYDRDATCVVSAAVPFTAAHNTVEEDGDAVLILLAYDGTDFDEWDFVVADVNEDVNSTLVTASVGEQGSAEPFEAITTEGGVDSRLCKAGQILYRTEGIIVCVEDTTAAETDTSKYMFFAKDAG